MTREKNDRIEGNIIYKYLKDNHYNDFVSLIDEVYSFCEKVLGEIPKLFSDYTLHDIGHSIRVINYMTNLIDSDLDKYSSLHLTMIIITGLLHDTGMFVSDEEFEQLKDCFKSENPLFGDRELDDKVKNYIRKNHAKRVGQSVLEEEIGEGASLRSRFVVGYSYNYSSIVALICQSHNENCEWIRDNIQTEAEIADYKISPQQIAFLLRIGDALDIDDRRAPTFLAKILKIKGYSQNEWRKHVPISNYEKIRVKNGEHYIYFRGNCSEPDIYRSLLKHIEYIQNDITSIEKMSFLLPDEYRININHVIENTIETEGFRSTTLEFTLDYKKIVRLLMGENIYGTKEAGLRELVQNSIDATQIMKEQLSEHCIISYNPVILVDVSKSQNEICVYDNGTGMNIGTLNDYFFKIGNSYYTSEEFKEQNYRYIPIGHFGIGFLACFMLSEHIVMETKTKEMNQAICVEFEKDSPFIIIRDIAGDSFPEGHGTLIKLKYDEVIGNVFNNENEMIDYLRSTFLTEGFSLHVRSNEDNNDVVVKSRIGERGDRIIKQKDIDVYYEINDFPDMIYRPYQLVHKANTVFFYFGEQLGLSSFDEYGYISIDYLVESLEEMWNKTEVDTIEGMPLDYSDSDQRVQMALKALEINDEVGEDISERVERGILDLCYSERKLKWISVPIIYDSNILNSFIQSENEVGYENALRSFKEYIEYFYVFGLFDTISNETIISMADTVSELSDGTAFDISDPYTKRYIFDPYPSELDAIKSKSGTFFLPIIHDYSFQENDVEQKVYMNGVLVRDANVDIKNAIYGTNLKKVHINVHSDQYSLNVARTEFEEQSNESLCRRVAYLLYTDMLERIDSDMLEEMEKEEISRYIKNSFI